MLVQDAVASCQQIIEHASGSVLLRVILIIVFVILPLLRVIFSVLKTKKQVHTYTVNCNSVLPEELLAVIKKHDMPQELFFVACSQEIVAVSVGFFNKKIILSKKLISSLDSFELEAIVLHEYYHVVSSHAFKILVLEILAKSFFFLPVLSDLTHYVKARFETAADSFAVGRQKTSKHILSSLKKVISSEANLQLYPQFSYLIIDQRIDALKKIHPRAIINYFNFFISVLSVLFFMGIFLFNSTYAVAQTMEEMETKITCSLFDCVHDCVAHEFIQKQVPMSENNFSTERN